MIGYCKYNNICFFFNVTEYIQNISLNNCILINSTENLFTSGTRWYNTIAPHFAFNDDKLLAYIRKMKYYKA